MTDEAYEQGGRELTRKLAEARREQAKTREQIAFNNGKIEATIQGLRRDPEIVAAVDQMAKKRGLDPAVLMDETIEAALAKHLPADATPAEPEPPTVDPAVSKFRDMLS